MHDTSLRVLAQPTISRFGVSPAAATYAVRRALNQFQAESYDPAIAQAGRTPAEYLAGALSGPRFTATVHSIALAADGREVDARLFWEAHRQREIDAVQQAHLAVPTTALLGSLEAIHRVGESLGLGAARTEELTAGIVLMIAAGYPHRPRELEHLTLTDCLTQIGAEDLRVYLAHAALIAGGHSAVADVLQRAVLNQAR
ncbi:hypothetical protein ACWFR1_22875 [Streptomyces sp. NPDC055103]